MVKIGFLMQKFVVLFSFFRSCLVLLPFFFCEDCYVILSDYEALFVRSAGGVGKAECFCEEAGAVPSVLGLGL